MNMLQKTRQFLASPVMMFYLIPWLMVLVVLGTISQRYIGLYQSQNLFFSSFILWLGPIPTPGMYSVLIVLALSLTVKLIDKSPWSIRQSGNVITHAGALLLLVGAFVTATFSDEGAITLKEGASSSVIVDYHARELSVFDGEQLLARFDENMLNDGEVLKNSALPFDLRVTKAFRDAEVFYCDDTQKEVCIRKNPQPSLMDEEARFGLEVVYQDANGAEKTFIAFESAVEQPPLIYGDKNYKLELRKEQRELPFMVQLDRFEKTSYPGSDTAKEYESVVTVTDGELSWQTAIRMNEPLRYRGYTLYQSSFLQHNGEEYSVLAVVKNAGRSFPYISSLVMCFGLLVHLFVRRRT